MGSVKNMIWGFVFVGIYAVTTIILPIYLFSFYRSFEGIFPEVELGFTQQDYENVIFWLTSIGIIICACAFLTHSSPKQSIRKGVFALIQVIVNCLYLWSYKFSGASEITFVIIDYGFFSLDLSQMILIYMGVYFLTIVLKVYDVIDFTINREKIRENRMKE